MSKEKSSKKSLLGVLILLTASFIWGSSFVAQSVGMEDVEAFTFSGVRSIMGALVLLPVILIKDGIEGRRMSAALKAERKAETKRSVLYGCVLGVFLCIATNFQQFAFYYSTSGKIAFVTALYMFFVPIFGLFMRKRLPWLTWLSVALGFWGLFMLCVNPAELSNVNKGDLLSVACAFFFAFHILFIEKFAPKADGIKLSCTQFAVSGIISCVLMFVFETPSIAEIKNAAVPLMYSGIMSCGIAYTFQIIGQKHTEATVASLIMCMESVFGVLCGALILQERMKGREIAGCVIMFCAILLSQSSDKLTAMLKMRKAKKLNK